MILTGSCCGGSHPQALFFVGALLQAQCANIVTPMDVVRGKLVRMPSETWPLGWLKSQSFWCGDAMSFFVCPGTTVLSWTKMEWGSIPLVFGRWWCGNGNFSETFFGSGNQHVPWGWQTELGVTFFYLAHETCYLQIPWDLRSTKKMESNHHAKTRTQGCKRAGVKTIYLHTSTREVSLHRPSSGKRELRSSPAGLICHSLS